MMRYFFALTAAEAVLSSGTGMARTTRCAPARHSHRCDTLGRDHNVDTPSHGSGNAHSETSWHWEPSANAADEGWIYTRRSAAIDGLCESTVWAQCQCLTVKSGLALCLSLLPHIPYRLFELTSPAQTRVRINPSVKKHRINGRLGDRRSSRRGHGSVK
jgi:hypothetical protein